MFFRLTGRHCSYREHKRVHVRSALGEICMRTPRDISETLGRCYEMHMLGVLERLAALEKDRTKHRSELTLATRTLERSWRGSRCLR